MGLFGSNKDDTRAKIEELKAKMQQGQGQQQQPPQQAPQQQAWQEQPQQDQGWQPPREQQAPQQPQPPTQPKQQSSPTVTSSSSHHKDGILLELGEGMSLNLPIKEKMRLDEFLRIADRVRELKKIDHS